MRELISGFVEKYINVGLIGLCLKVFFVEEKIIIISIENVVSLFLSLMLILFFFLDIKELLIFYNFVLDISNNVNMVMSVIKWLLINNFVILFG